MWKILLKRVLQCNTAFTNNFLSKVLTVHKVINRLILSFINIIQPQQTYEHNICLLL